MSADQLIDVRWSREILALAYRGDSRSAARRWRRRCMQANQLAQLVPCFAMQSHLPVPLQPCRRVSPGHAAGPAVCIQTGLTNSHHPNFPLQTSSTWARCRRCWARCRSCSQACACTPCSPSSWTGSPSEFDRKLCMLIVEKQRSVGIVLPNALPAPRCSLTERSTLFVLFSSQLRCGGPQRGGADERRGCLWPDERRRAQGEAACRTAQFFAAK